MNAEEIEQEEGGEEGGVGWVRESPSSDTAPVLLLLLLLVLLQFDTLSERGHCCIRGPRSIPQRAPSERVGERTCSDPAAGCSAGGGEAARASSDFSTW